MLELIKKNSDAAMKEIEKLRSELNALKKDKDAQERFNKSVRVLNVTEKETAKTSVNQPTKKQASAMYVASKNSNKYHYPSCTLAQKISSKNLVRFNSPEEAIKAGYIPCKVCKPPSKSNVEMRSEKYLHALKVRLMETEGVHYP